MRISALILSLLICGAVRAEDTVQPLPESPAAQEISAAENSPAPKLNSFGTSEETIQIINNQDGGEIRLAPEISPRKPTCENPMLLTQVHQAVSAWQQKSPAENIYDRRARLLTIKNIRSFAAVDVESFVPADNYKVADRMITVKINERLSNQDLQLCVSNNPILKDKIYLLLRPLNDDTVGVDVLNYPGTEKSPISFVFRPEN